MAVLKNRTQGGFTMINNGIFRDRDLGMKDRGVLCTILSLPDGWKFSIAGLAAVVKDGKESVTGSVKRLENMGYLIRRVQRGMDGKFTSEIEVFDHPIEKSARKSSYHDGFPVTAEPARKDRGGSTATGKQSQYKKDYKKKKSNTENIISINPSGEGEMDEINQYRDLIADNIHLDWLLEIAGQHDESEGQMVNEIFNVILQMVAIPRDKVVIKGAEYPWKVVKSQFLKLRYEHVCAVLDRIVDADLHIQNMESYLISTLYSESMVGVLEVQASLHDEYLKWLRGKPYEF